MFHLRRTSILLFIGLLTPPQFSEAGSGRLVVTHEFSDGVIGGLADAQMMSDEVSGGLADAQMMSDEVSTALTDAHSTSDGVSATLTDTHELNADVSTPLSDAPTPSNGVSGTLPVMHILTADGIPITSKQEYVNAVYWLDPMGTEGIKAVGSADAPLPLQIRGRGNYTWNSFQKKPYRLKLDEFQPLLGMNRSRHFALLAHADDKLAFLRNTVGFELSRRMGMPYTPAQQPLEVVLNGEYIGLYFLAETIRPEKHRLNITEQKNGEQNPDRITGGWLVEINNNHEDNQLDFPIDGTDLQWFWVTYHSPDSLSPLQRDYLFGQFQSMLQAVYDPDKTSTDWEQLIDVHSLAQFYVIQEVLDHTEAFLGSCYLWKDLGEQHWKFGPVWDFGHAFNSSHSKSRFIYEQTPFPVSIIREIARFPRFQQEVRRVWSAFYPDSLNGIEQYMTDFLGTIAEAAKANAQRWPDYGNADVYASAAPAFDRLRQKVRWLNEQWKQPYPDDGQPQENSIRSVEADSPSAAYYTLSGQLLTSPPARGLYIEAPRGSAAGRGKKFLKKNHTFLW